MIRKFNGITPDVSEKAYVDPMSCVIGEVVLSDDVSIWPCAVIRGDESPIYIGEKSNVQDNAVIHTIKDMPATIGRNVTIGHGAIVHSATVGDNVIIGMGAVVLDGAVIGSDTIIAAGAVVSPNKTIPSGSMVMGIPGKVVRELTAQEKENILINAAEYVHLIKVYKED